MNKVLLYKNYCKLVIKRRDGQIWYSKFDKEMLAEVQKSKWFLFDNGREVYVRRTKNGKRPVFLHSLMLKAPKGFYIDHINRDSLDNRRCNLRIATRSQNRINSKINKNNTSGCKGVIFYNKTNTWNARISLNNRRIFLGYFKTKEEAINARKAAEKIYHA